ncbi:unnamed protein product [Heligmosomoides polygyrus]|uniref:Reverse transcriptase domain-containing protein n=1 Tax=Heligmosomoides polygyrus TaxID=6339 RepID=A0A183GT89_HELPZ|nr:unnamed protein product [Heligmosomoides polygyrus]
MRELEWEFMGVKIDGRQLHRLRFADDIVLITPSITTCISGREVNMANDLAPELKRRKRAAWGAFKSVEEVAKKIPLFFLP